MPDFEQVGHKNPRVFHKDKQVVRENEQVYDGDVEASNRNERVVTGMKSSVIRKSWLRIQTGRSRVASSTLLRTSSFERQLLVNK
jgi:hypothetical protein